MAEKYWTLKGNANTDPGDFVGTTDDKRLSFGTNDLVRLSIETNGTIKTNGTVRLSHDLDLVGHKVHLPDPMGEMFFQGNIIFYDRDGNQMAGISPSPPYGLALSGGADMSPENVVILAPGGKVGIGTVEPQAQLHISTQCGGNGSLMIDNDINVGNNISVKGDITLQNADIAEQFEVIDPRAAEPGVVMVLDDTGSLAMSKTAYDRRVAGVVSGAGSYRPGIVLDNHNRPGQIVIALVGKVFCRVDAETAAIAVGDLLTTSNTPGHAMKALDRDLAFGATLGKALKPLSTGKGMIPILVALQ